MDDKNSTLAKTKAINYKPLLYTGAFAQYLIMVGIRSLEYTHDDKTLYDNLEYFKLCKEHGLSAYKALLFLQDYIDGDYVF